MALQLRHFASLGQLHIGARQCTRHRCIAQGSGQAAAFRQQQGRGGHRSVEIRHTDDFVFALPGRRIDGHRIAFQLADQRTRQR